MLYLTAEVASGMVAHCRSRAPEEACGVLAGHYGGAAKWFRLTNDHSEPLHNFTVNSDEWVNLVVRLADQGLTIWAIVHSHPSGPSQPSVDDVNGHLFEQVLMVIVDLTTDRITAWRLVDGEVVPVEVVVKPWVVLG